MLCRLRERPIFCVPPFTPALPTTADAARGMAWQAASLSIRGCWVTAVVRIPGVSWLGLRLPLAAGAFWRRVCAGLDASAVLGLRLGGGAPPRVAALALESAPVAGKEGPRRIARGDISALSVEFRCSDAREEEGGKAAERADNAARADVFGGLLPRPLSGALDSLVATCAPDRLGESLWPPSDDLSVGDWDLRLPALEVD